MMFIFPFIYLLSFLFAFREIIKGNSQDVLIFLIFGLPIYITALSITFNLGFKDFVGLFQSFKEIIIVTLLGIQIWTLKTRVRFHVIDYMVIAFWGYTFLYVLLPIGEYGFIARLIAFKSTSFFALIYFTGRLFDPRSIYINKYFHYILYVTIAAALMAVFEFITNQHFQTLIGYGDFYYYIFNLEPSGNYGLSWTFESAGGFKRFASFFANPLEHAAATLLALSVIAGLYTSDDYKFKPDLFGKIALVATFLSIIFAVSRAPFVSYFIIIYVYALFTRKKLIIYSVNTCIIAGIIYLFYMIRNDNLVELIINTFNFSDPSSAGHLLEWINGILAIYQNPFGLGLGTSGRVASSLGETTGGENQFIIIGVQAGVIALIIYIVIYISLIKETWHWFYRLKGKEKKVCLSLLLIKIGFIIPLLTSEVESSPYISYMVWFLTGLFVNMIANKRMGENTINQNSLTINPDSEKID